MQQNAHEHALDNKRREGGRGREDEHKGRLSHGTGRRGTGINTRATQTRNEENGNIGRGNNREASLPSDETKKTSIKR